LSNAFVEPEAMSEPDLRSAYVDALRAYVAEASEKALSRGREIGKLSVQAGLDSSDIAEAHCEALRAGEQPDVAGELLDERSLRFLVEVLQPFSSARHRLEQMSHELAEMNDTLIERSKELEIANTELETFSYSISHDLRTSLQAVLGFAQTLDARHSENLPPQARRCIELIIKGARGMNELVDDLLQLAQANRLPLELESVDLDLLAREAIGELEPQITASNADLVLGELPVVDADRVLLKRVFVNLISNAIKFSRGAEPRARVEVGSMQPNEVPVLFVRDNGVGFDMGQSGRLFQAFERLHGGGDFEGTGVGLALVARIVDRHGGRIWAESEPGKGASFYFTLAGDAASTRATDRSTKDAKKRPQTDSTLSAARTAAGRGRAGRKAR
jgi:signal transduction histidine kinase